MRPQKGSTNVHANSQVVRLLVEAGADTNCQNRVGKTALMYVAEVGDLPTVQVLLEARAGIEPRHFVEHRVELLSCPAQPSVAVSRYNLEERGSTQPWAPNLVPNFEVFARAAVPRSR